MRACLEPGCGTLVARGRCRAHTPTTTQRGLGWEHQRLVPVVLLRKAIAAMVAMGQDALSEVSDGGD